jgi:ribonucleoside-diphosphate reductase alpha chain
MQKWRLVNYGANVSVKLDDEFMRSAIRKALRSAVSIDSTSPKYRQVVNAADIWKKIIHNAWKSAEPACFSGIQ